MSNETIKPIPVSELMEIPFYDSASIKSARDSHVKQINNELIGARKSGASTASVEIHNEEIITDLLYEYSKAGYSVQWDKYTKKLILKWR